MENVANPDDLLPVVVISGFAMAYMAWGIGANDVANAFGPAFGSNSLTVRQACYIAVVFEALGAILMGGMVSDTIRKGIMSVELYSGDDGRVLMMVGMTSVLLAAATWLLVASKFGLPVSTTHSAVGGVIAMAVASKGYESVMWSKIGMIIASWFVSPVMSAVVGFIVYTIVNRCVLKQKDSAARARIAAPVFVFIVSFVVAQFTIYKGGKGLGLHKTSMGVSIGVAAGIGLILAGISFIYVKWWAGRIESMLKADAEKGLKSEAKADLDSASSGQEEVPDSTKPDKETEKDPEKTNAIEPDKSEEANVASDQDAFTSQFFTGLTVIMAAFFSLAHGANDVANSVGPFGAVLAAYDGPLEKKSEIPIWVFILAGAMIAVGLATYGVHVMRTIGTKITAMTPPKAFCVNFSATLVVLLATRLGIPISTTHASVGAVVGVGLAEGVRNIEWLVMVKIVTSWIMTLPIVAITASGVFALFLPCVVGVPFPTSASNGL